MSEPVRSKGRPGYYPVEIAEREQRVMALTRLGHSAVEIARRLGIASRTVARIRARRRQEAA